MPKTPTAVTSPLAALAVTIAATEDDATGPKPNMNPDVKTGLLIAGITAPRVTVPNTPVTTTVFGLLTAVGKAAIGVDATALKPGMA